MSAFIFLKILIFGIIIVSVMPIVWEFVKAKLEKRRQG